jgi:glycosyltransferase involved in cell wall biosynthesis
VVDGENGFLVPPRDAAALEEAMERFIVDPSLIQPMGARSRRMAEDIFDVRRVNEAVLAAARL